MFQIVVMNGSGSVAWSIAKNSLSFTGFYLCMRSMQEVIIVYPKLATGIYENSLSEKVILYNADIKINMRASYLNLMHSERPILLHSERPKLYTYWPF